jgi:hypothetical protein
VPDGSGWKGYVEFLPPGLAPGTGPWRVDQSGTVTTATAAAVLAPSGDTSGAADAAAITAAVAALPAAGGQVTLLATGPWYLKCGQVSINASGVLINAPGVTVNAVGTGDVIRMHDTSNINTRTVYGGGITGFPVIDGTSAGAASTGLHIGDIFQLQVDVAVQNFSGTGGIGVHFDNASYWTEQLRAHVYAQNCATGVNFDVTGALTSTTSYARADVSLWIDQVGPTFDGVTFTNGATIYDGQFVMGGNFGGSSSALTSATLRLTGQSPAGHPDAGAYSSIKQSHVRIGCECESAAHTPFTQVYGSVSHNVIGDCYGIIDYGFSGTNFAAAASASSLYPFAGEISGDAVLAGAMGVPFQKQWNISGGVAVGDFSAAQVLASSGTISTAGRGTAKVAPAGNVTGIVLLGGTSDGQQCTVINESAFTVTFAAAGTSNVADGASDVIAALSSRLFTWDFSTGLWYKAA